MTVTAAVSQSEALRSSAQQCVLAHYPCDSADQCIRLLSMLRASAADVR